MSADICNNCGHAQDSHVLKKDGDNDLSKKHDSCMHYFKTDKYHIKCRCPGYREMQGKNTPEEHKYICGKVNEFLIKYDIVEATKNGLSKFQGKFMDQLDGIDGTIKPLQAITNAIESYASVASTVEKKLMVYRIIQIFLTIDPDDPLGVEADKQITEDMKRNPQNYDGWYTALKSEEAMK